MTHQKPPPGFIFVQDYKEEDGTILQGIANRLGITEHTLKKWRMAEKGPHYITHGKRVIARPEWIDEWFAAQEQPTRQPTPEMRPPEPRAPHAGRTRNAKGRQPAKTAA